MSLRFCSALLLALLTGLNSPAQIRVSRVDINKWVRENFTGQGVVIGNIKVHGNILSMAAFSSSANVLDLQKGLMLSTGSAFSVAGLNNKYNQTHSYALRYCSGGFFLCLKNTIDNESDQ